MNKRKLTRSLMAACSIVAITAVMYGCGGGGGDAEAPATDMSDMEAALGAAQTAAATAATAAEDAAGAAHTAVMGQSANMAADPGSYAIANNAAMRARAAADAARAASAAAAATMDADEAKAQQAIAEDKQTEAETEQGNAEMYAGMVMTAQQAIDDAAEEAADLAAAKTAADMAATAAEGAADKAEAAAARVAELTGAGSEQHMMATEAATAARDAATAARAASALAQDATMSGDAEGYRDTAVAEQGKAETQYAEADELRREAQVASDTGTMQQEQRDIADAQDAAKEAADEAMDHYTAAMGKATDARSQATMARAAANRAMRARTDYANADKYADMAEANADAAEAARDRAETANNDAQGAYTAAMGATTADDAEMYQEQAEDANAIATTMHMGDDDDETTVGAGENYKAAKAAAEKAATYANTHVLGLFKLANADNIRSAPDPDANSDESEAELIAKNKAVHVAAVNAAVAAEALSLPADTSQNAAEETSVVGYTDTDDDGPGATDTGTRWPYDGNFGDDEKGDGEGLLTVAVQIGNDTYTTTRDDPDTDDDETNFTAERGLGDFIHGFEISADTFDQTTTPPTRESGARILVFTDKEQANEPMDAREAAVQNAAVTASQVVEADPPAGITGASFDHDNDPDTDPLTGTYTCDPDDECTIAIGDNGEITSITGYTFSSTAFPDRQDIVAEVTSDEDESYLAFGVWLQDVVADGTNTYTFGAFAGGGSPYDAAAANAGPVAAIEGEATYEGKAAGVHSINSSVDYFEGDATLNANFREGETNALGMITGKIHNIVAGGVGGYDDIYLSLSDQDVAAVADRGNNISDTGTFSGRASMGTGILGADREQDYDFNGTWSGGFYNQVLDDPDTATVTESEMPPMSVAGTFGVTYTDDMGTTTGADAMDDDITESFVGAFGAHR